MRQRHAATASVPILGCTLRDDRGTSPLTPRAEPRLARAAAAPPAPPPVHSAGGRAPLRTPGPVLAVAVHRTVVTHRRLPPGAADACARGAARREGLALSNHAAHGERARLSLLRRRISAGGTGDDPARNGRNDRGAVTRGERGRHEAPITHEQLEAIASERLGGFRWRTRTLAPLVHLPPSGTWRFHGRPQLLAMSQWLGVELPGREEGAEHLVRSYLAALGPATQNDLVRFAGVRTGDVRPGLERS